MRRAWARIVITRGERQAPLPHRQVRTSFSPTSTYSTSSPTLCGVHDTALPVRSVLEGRVGHGVFCNAHSCRGRGRQGGGRGAVAKVSRTTRAVYRTTIVVVCVRVRGHSVCYRATPHMVMVSLLWCKSHLCLLR